MHSKPSLADYVLERARKDYCEFRPSQLRNQSKDSSQQKKKLLDYLLDTQAQQVQPLVSFSKISPVLLTHAHILRMQTLADRTSISVLKHQQISAQYTSISQKLHHELSRKSSALQDELTRLENQWISKDVPVSYKYYFLKFACANTMARIQSILIEERLAVARSADPYSTLLRVVEARENCLKNIKRDASLLDKKTIEECLHKIIQQMAVISKQRVSKQPNTGQILTTEVGRTPKDWKNKLELLFESISHLRKLTVFMVESVNRWKSTIYNLTTDPKRFRQRIVFYHRGANYLLQALADTQFLGKTEIANYLKLTEGVDPLFLYPVMVFETTHKKLRPSDVVLQTLLQPAAEETKKILDTIQFLAQQYYEQTTQTHFLKTRAGHQNNMHKQDDVSHKEADRKSMSSSQRSRAASSKRVQTPADNSAAANRDIPALRTYSNSLKQMHKRIKQKYDSKKNSEERILPPSINKNVQRSNLKQSIVKQLFRNSGKSQMKTERKVATAEPLDQSKLRSLSYNQLKKITPYLSKNKAKDVQAIIESKASEKPQETIRNIDKIKPTESPTRPVSREQRIQRVGSILVPLSNSQAHQERDELDKLKAHSDLNAFSKYIQQNIQTTKAVAHKKEYLYKNKISAQKYEGPQSNYKKLGFHERKQLLYNNSLKQFRNPASSQKNSQVLTYNDTEVDDHSSSLYRSPLVKTVIEISNDGVKRKIKAPDQVLNIKQSSLNDSELKKSKAVNQPDQIVIDSSGRPVTSYSRVSMQPSSPKTEAKEQPQDIIVFRQEPQKLEQIKELLYNKIKEELLEELRRQGDANLSQLAKKEAERQVALQIQNREALIRENSLKDNVPDSKKQLKIDFANQIRVEPSVFFEGKFDKQLQQAMILNPDIFNRLFETDLTKLMKTIAQSLYPLWLKLYLKQELIGHMILKLDESDIFRRKFSLVYVSLKDTAYFLGALQCVLEYLWSHDPAQELSVRVLKQLDKSSDQALIEQLIKYSEKNGITFSKNLYSNSQEVVAVFLRDQERNPAQNFRGRSDASGGGLTCKVQLFAANATFKKEDALKIDLNLEYNTSYTFLLEQVFRSHTTAEQAAQLRQNIQQIPRVKDIFEIVKKFNVNKPKITQMKVLEAMNVDDMTERIKATFQKALSRYQWRGYFDSQISGRLVLALIESTLRFPYPINSGSIDGRPYLRIHADQPVLHLRSSITPQDDIIMFNTSDPKIKLFFMPATRFRQMRIQLFVFLNMVLTSIIKDERKNLSNLWIPQFRIVGQRENAEESGRMQNRQVSKVTDFSMVSKKSFWIGEEVYFCNREYIPNCMTHSPIQSDQVFAYSLPFIFGLIHSDIQKEAAGVPIYARVIDKEHLL